MSAIPTAYSLKTIVQALEKWTPDSLKRYASFKDVQRKRYEDLLGGPQSGLNAQHLALQASAMETLVSGVNKNKFPATEKLTQPSGNPNYYNRLIDEITPGRPKTGMFTAIRHVIFGGYN